MNAGPETYLGAWSSQTFLAFLLVETSKLLVERQVVSDGVL